MNKIKLYKIKDPELIQTLQTIESALAKDSDIEWPKRVQTDDTYALNQPIIDDLESGKIVENARTMTRSITCTADYNEPDNLKAPYSDIKIGEHTLECLVETKDDNGNTIDKSAATYIIRNFKFYEDTSDSLTLRPSSIVLVSDEQ